MDEKVTLYRDINSGKEGSDPVYQRWFPKTVDEAVVMTDEEDATLETNLKTRLAQLKQEIADMEAEAFALKKATETLKSTTDSLKSATDTLKSTTDTIQSDVTKVKSDITNINGNLSSFINNMWKDYGQSNDPNTITKPGMYYVTGNTANAPTNSGFLILHFNSGDRIAQIALINGESNNYFVRTKPTGSGATYSKWRRLLTDDDTV